MLMRIWAWLSVVFFFQNFSTLQHFFSFSRIFLSQMHKNLTSFLTFQSSSEWIENIHGHEKLWEKTTIKTQLKNPKPHACTCNSLKNTIFLEVILYRQHVVFSVKRKAIIHLISSHSLCTEDTKSWLVGRRLKINYTLMGFNLLVFGFIGSAMTTTTTSTTRIIINLHTWWKRTPHLLFKWKKRYTTRTQLRTHTPIHWIIIMKHLL